MMRNPIHLALVTAALTSVIVAPTLLWADDHGGAAIAAATVVALAPPGATPGGLIVEIVQRTAVIRAVDKESRRVQLDVPAGYRVTLKVGADVDLEGVQVGEKVIATHTEALAIELTKP
jgi:hypothetical protein